jgi:nucleoside 2-deoxyribosyltransferase
MRDKQKLYLAGPISNVPQAELRFANAEFMLRSAGFEVVNPFSILADLLIPGYDRMDRDEKCKAQLRADLIHMLMCDGIASLPLDAPSEGMARELHVAHSLGMDVRTLQQWVEASS